MVTGLWGAGLSDQIDGSVVAGDVVLYPKFQMLVANSESLARLSDEQRDMLDEIVAEVHGRALNRHFSEAELAAGICKRGGTVVEAGTEAVAALKAAARPLSETMAADPIIGDVMERVSDLAGQTPDDGGAGTCEPLGAAATTDRGPVAIAPDLAGHSGSELLPDGTYRVEVHAEDLEAAGADPYYAAINEGVWTLTVEGDRMAGRASRHERGLRRQPGGRG